MRRLVTLIVGLVGVGAAAGRRPADAVDRRQRPAARPLPSLGEIWDALLGPDTGRLFIGALVLIGAVAWVIMAAAIVLEIPAALAGRSMPRIRGMGWAQRTASVLLFMIITGTVASTMTAAQALPPLPAAPISMAAASLSAPRRGPVCGGRPGYPSQRRGRVRRGETPDRAAASGLHRAAGDTPWSIAEKTLGSGERASEIVALNTGQNPGRRRRAHRDHLPPPRMGAAAPGGRPHHRPLHPRTLTLDLTFNGLGGVGAGAAGGHVERDRAAGAG